MPQESESTEQAGLKNHMTFHLRHAPHCRSNKATSEVDAASKRHIHFEAGLLQQSTFLRPIIFRIFSVYDGEKHRHFEGFRYKFMKKEKGFPIYD